MGIWPTMRVPLYPMITPWCLESCGAVTTALAATDADSAAGAAWPAANLALFVPFFVAERVTIVKLGIKNGTVATANLDIGIYDALGTRLVSVGGTAQIGGNGNFQTYDVTDTQLLPGVYYLAVAFDTSAGTIARGLSGASAATMSITGMVEQTSAYPLPATATFAALTHEFLPMVCATIRTEV